MKKKNYERAELDIIMLSDGDVICTSADSGEDNVGGEPDYWG